MKLLLLILGLLFTSGTAHAGALATLAASMPVGTWATLTTTGDAVLRVGGSTGTMMPFSMSAVWDPTSGTVQYVGNDHNAPSLRHVIYTEATNTWSLAFANPGLGVAHGYEHLALNTFTNQIYHRQYGLGDDIQISRYSGGAGGTWSPFLWTGINCGYEQVAMAIGFWSGTMTGITAGVGTLVIYDSGEPKGRVCMINPANGTVQFSTSGFGGNSTYHSFFEYSPVKNVAVFGGGNDNATNIWRLNADRTVTTLTNAPVSLGIQRGFVTVDPVTGNFLVLAGGVLRQLDPAGSGTWTLASSPPAGVGNPGSPNLANMFTVPISTYGVVMYVTCTSSSCNVSLYKHTASLPTDTTPPSQPTNLVATPISTTQINLSWTASTDNVAVSGYRVERALGGGCASFVEVYATGTNSQNDTGLAVDTTYCYRVRAIDSSSNFSTYSSTVIAATPPPGSADFTTRCAAAGVILCEGFDTTAAFTNCVGGAQGCYGSPMGILPPSGTTTYSRMIRDTVVAADGASSLKAIIPTQTPADTSGSWFTNFTQFTSGQTFYIQWRQRFSACFLYQGTDDANCLANGLRRSFAGGGGWKQVIISAGDKAGCSPSSTANCMSSCTALEIVTQNTNHRGVPQQYHSCIGGDGAPAFAAFEEPFGGSDFKLQNAHPGFCPYSQVVQAAPYNLANCVKYYPNEWMTFTQRVTLGTYDGNSYPNSTVEEWIARDGQASIKVQAYVAGVNAKNLINSTPGEIEKYGKIWLLPYNTAKSSSEVHPEAYTWYDSLIISTQPIADPGASIPLPPTLKSVTTSGKTSTVGKTVR